MDRRSDISRRALSLSGAAALVVGLVMVLTGTSAVAATDFTKFAAPLTGATAFAVNFPSKPFTPGPVGPVGMIDDGTNYFVSDFADGLLYRFPVTGGDATTVPTALDHLHGLAVVNGVYYGTSTASKAVVSFDPGTLALTQTHIPIPCAGLGLVGDPQTGNILVDTTCGIDLIQNPTSGTPTVTKFSGSKDELDGIALSPDGLQIWVADETTRQVLVLDRSANLLTAVPDPQGPDGMVFATDHTTLGGVDVSNNVFVNNQNGTIIRIDTNDNFQVSVVASGGTRGDYAIAGPDGCFYVTQSTQVEKVAPCFFVETGVTTTTTPAGPTTTVAHPSTTAPPTTALPTTPTTLITSSAKLAFTGPGTGLRWTAGIGFLLALLGCGLFLAGETRPSGWLAWLVGRST